MKEKMACTCEKPTQSPTQPTDTTSKRNTLQREEQSPSNRSNIARWVFRSQGYTPSDGKPRYLGQNAARAKGPRREAATACVQIVLNSRLRHSKTSSRKPRGMWRNVFALDGPFLLKVALNTEDASWPRGTASEMECQKMGCVRAEER